MSAGEIVSQLELMRVDITAVGSLEHVVVFPFTTVPMVCPSCVIAGAAKATGSAMAIRIFDMRFILYLSLRPSECRRGGEHSRSMRSVYCVYVTGWRPGAMQSREWGRDCELERDSSGVITGGMIYLRRVDSKNKEPTPCR